jgi:flagellar motor switch protein FliN/FliY
VTEPASKTISPAAVAKADSALGQINPKLIETVSVTLEAYLGEARMTVAELTALKDSSVVPLDAALNQSVELRLNGVAVARGELVAVGDSFAVRLTEIAK